MPVGGWKIRRQASIANKKVRSGTYLLTGTRSGKPDILGDTTIAGSIQSTILKVDGNINVSGDKTVNGNETINGNLSVTGLVTGNVGKGGYYTTDVSDISGEVLEPSRIINGFTFYGVCAPDDSVTTIYLPTAAKMITELQSYGITAGSGTKLRIPIAIQNTNTNATSKIQFWGEDWEGLKSVTILPQGVSAGKSSLFGSGTYKFVNIHIFFTSSTEYTAVITQGQ